MRPPLHYLLYRAGLVPAETQTTAAERDCIARHAAGKKVAVEIGVWHGVTTCRIAQALDPRGTLHAVDNFPVGRFGVSFQERVARRETRKWAGNITFQRGDSTAIAKRLKNASIQQVEFIFIDGDHSFDGLKSDWEAWTPLLAPGGVVALHDSRPSDTMKIEDAGSVRFTREVILRHPDFQLLEQVDTLSVVQKSRA
jgi:predicted O-methyltransferase YrrM